MALVMLLCLTVPCPYGRSPCCLRSVMSLCLFSLYLHLVSRVRVSVSVFVYFWSYFDRLLCVHCVFASSVLLAWFSSPVLPGALHLPHYFLCLFKPLFVFPSSCVSCEFLCSFLACIPTCLLSLSIQSHVSSAITEFSSMPESSILYNKYLSHSDKG